MAAMYDEQNARRLLADPVAFHNEATTAAMLPLLIALDAERARAAELQQRLDAQPYESEGELVRLLAAREAEVVELREALEVAWGIIANAHGGDWSLASEQWQWASARWRDDSWHAILILSRAPGGNEALRALLERAWMAGAGTKASDFEDERPDQVCARDLARLLGPTGDGAQKGAEG